MYGSEVALALDALIRTQFPRDTLHIVGFFTYAQELKLEDLPYLTPKPFGFFPYMYSDMYHKPMGYLDFAREYHRNRKLREALIYLI